MTESPQSPESRSAPLERVGQVWPPIGGLEPVRGWPIPWPLAPLAGILGVFFPRTLGPHLAASSWWAAYFAHFVCLIYAFGIPASFFIHGSIGQSIPSAREILLQDLRSPPAALGLILMSLSNSSQVYEFLVGFAVLEALPWIGGPLLLLQFVAVGQTKRLAYLQSAKLMLWSTCWLLPAMVLFILSVEWIDRWSQGADTSAMIFAVAALWWFLVLIRLSARYGGPAIGPRWENRTPRCEGCSYSLTGLRVDALSGVRPTDCRITAGARLPGFRAGPRAGPDQLRAQFRRGNARPDVR